VVEEVMVGLNRGNVKKRTRVPTTTTGVRIKAEMVRKG